MRFLPLILPLAAATFLSGCHSAFINATVSNHTTETLSLIEVDYPSASFGTQTLPPGQDFHYRFKILGNGPTSVLWTDATQHDHKQSGPTLREGQDGAIHITFTHTPEAPQPVTPIWDLQLNAR